jgi:hypothetical protein
VTNDPVLLLAVSGAAAAGLALASGAGLKAWRQWLALRREALRSGGRPGSAGELRGLRERVRRLEAIADGVSR